MNWYKKAQINYPIWLANQIQLLTNNYKKPLGHYEHYLPEIEKWIKETKPDLTNLSFDDAYVKATGHKYHKVEEGSPEDIQRNTNKFIAETQNISPDAPNFAVDIRLKSKSIPPNIKSKINKEIHDMGNYHIKIPLQQIMDICKKYGVVLIQEDGKQWSGALMGNKGCGEEEAIKNQRIALDLVFKQENGRYIPANNTLSMTWCKMPSSKYEIVAYVS